MKLRQWSPKSTKHRSHETNAGSGRASGYGTDQLLACSTGGAPVAADAPVLSRGVTAGVCGDGA
jgi:hypothetical protein